MYILMKDGKYFTGNIEFSSDVGQLSNPHHNQPPSHKEQYVEFIAWTRHPSAAKVWEKNRFWAQRAAEQRGGEVIEI